MKHKKTIEEKTCFDVMNLREWEATNIIRERGLCDRIIWRDGKDQPKFDPCYISHRIGLKIRRGFVIGTNIG